MNNIVNNLMIDNGLVSTDMNPGKLYHFSQDGIYSYWLVIEVTNIDTVLDEQSLYFTTAKDLLRDEWFDKNANLLVIYKVDTIDHIDKNHLIAIEENPYMFKKQVLVYTGEEGSSLTAAIEQSGKSAGKFILQKVLSNPVFERYKKNMNTDGYESLIYRIMHKIPFINVEVKQETGLSALKESNSQKVSDNGDKALDDIIQQNFFGDTTAEINTLSADEIYDVLIKVLEPDENK